MIELKQREMCNFTFNEISDLLLERFKESDIVQIESTDDTVLVKRFKQAESKGEAK